MKKFIFCVVLLVCFGPPLSVSAVIVDVNQNLLLLLEPDITITCISYFIPDTPNVPDSLIFTQPPQWTNSVPFDHITEGWDTAMTDANKTVYLFGPPITNNEPDPAYIFSYKLFFQLEEEEVVDYPVYLDIVVFNGDDIIYDSSRWGTPGSPYQWSEDLLDGPYENPVPEPMTVCILGLGTVLLIKRC